MICISHTMPLDDASTHHICMRMPIYERGIVAKNAWHRMDTKMSDIPSEQIGDLIFVRDPAYPYPFKVEVAPHFWMTEQTGKLADAVESYFQGIDPSPVQRTAMQCYLTQYIERALLLPGQNRNLLLQKVAQLRSQRDFERFADDLADVGIEPF